MNVTRSYALRHITTLGCSHCTALPCGSPGVLAREEAQSTVCVAAWAVWPGLPPSWSVSRDLLEVSLSLRYQGTEESCRSVTVSTSTSNKRQESRRARLNRMKSGLMMTRSRPVLRESHCPAWLQPEGCGHQTSLALEIFPASASWRRN